MSSYTVSLLSAIARLGEPIVKPLAHTALPFLICAKAGSILGTLSGKLNYIRHVNTITNEWWRHKCVVLKYTKQDQIHMKAAITAIVLGEIGSFYFSTEAGLYFTAGGIIGGIVGRKYWHMFL